MKKEWIIGALGLWVVMLAYFGFPSTTEKIFMIITGLVISFIGFRKGISEKVKEQTPKQNEEKQIPSA